MSRRKQANPAKLDSELNECGGSSRPEEVAKTTIEDDLQTTSPLAAEEMKLEEYNYYSDGSSQSDFGDPENLNSTPEASSPSSPLSDEECTQGVMENTPYGCRYCQKAFPRSYMLTRHEQTHTEQLQFTCSYCPRLFKHKRSRDRHTKLHTGDKKYKCQHCESAFSRSDHLKIHMKTHDGRKPYKCGTCNRGYNTAAALASHQQNHIKREGRESRTSRTSTPSPGASRCSQCTETFQNSDALQSHVAAIHKETSEETSKDEARVVCMYCSKEFPTLDSMYQHVGVFHAEMTNGTKIEASRNGAGSLFTCDRCNIQFDTLYKLTEHMNKIHWQLATTTTTETSYTLAKCPFQSQPTDLSHKRQNSDQKTAKRFKANETIKEASSTSGSPYESDDKPCICSCCYAQMPNFKSFLIHMENHVGQSAASTNSTFLRYCGICGEPGRDPVAFSNHIFSHAITSVRGRCCHACKKSFDNRDELHKHLTEIHTMAVYKCSICSVIFDTKAALKIHFTNKHDSECNHLRCYLCPDQIFHDRMSAELHVTMHHSQQLPSVSCPPSYQEMTVGMFRDYLPTFQCPICQQCFKEENLYFVHMINDHNDSTEDEKFWSDYIEHRQIPSLSPSKYYSKSPETSRKIDQKSPTTLTCDVCNVDVSSESELLAHKKLHSSKSKMGPVSLQCAYCNESCKSRNDLESHMKSHHVSCGKGKYKCNICDEIFTSSIILADHKLKHCKILSGNTCTVCKAVLVNEQAFYGHHIEHSPGKANSQIFLPVNCIICCQTLQTDVELKLHSKFHLKYLNQRMHLCRICKRVYETSSGKPVKTEQNHHQENLPVAVCRFCASPPTYRQTETNGGQMKRYACSLCPKSYDTEEEMQNHATVHVLNESSNLECRLCKQLFPSPTKLQVHLIEHNFYGMNQFTCYVCSSVFTAAAGLQAHIIGHGLNSRPYECNQCQMKFFFRAELDNHRFIHTSLAPYETPVKVENVKCGEDAAAGEERRSEGVESENNEQ